MMVNTYHDSRLIYKIRFLHFNILGFKFRFKTYPRVSTKKYNVYTDHQGLGLNFSKRNFKIYLG